MSVPVQLLVYRFGADAGFEGQLVGALERIEAGGSLKVLDVLFVAADATTGEVFAVDMRGSGAGGMVAPLLGFRLDMNERRRITRKALAAGPPDLIATLAETLGPGGALAAVLVGHVWTRALDDAVARIGGVELTNATVAATTLGELAEELAASARAG